MTIIPADVNTDHLDDQYWIKNLGLYVCDKNILLSKEWLNDNIITAAQKLLQDQSEGCILGLQSPQLAKSLNFTEVPPRSKFLQVLHVSDSHWILTSNIDIQQDCCLDDTVFISLRHSRISTCIKRQVCSILRPKNKHFEVGDC